MCHLIIHISPLDIKLTDINFTLIYLNAICFLGKFLQLFYLELFSYLQVHKAWENKDLLCIVLECDIPLNCYCGKIINIYLYIINRISSNCIYILMSILNLPSQVSMIFINRKKDTKLWWLINIYNSGVSWSDLYNKYELKINLCIYGSFLRNNQW